MTRDIRAKALEKIASLSAASTNTSFDRSDLDKLCRACHSGGRSREYNHGSYSSKSVGSLGRIPMVSSSTMRRLILRVEHTNTDSQSANTMSSSRSARRRRIFSLASPRRSCPTS
jgi:phosphatidylinositol 4-kinase